MLGESRWKVLVLIAGLLLAQAIDSPGRGSPQLKEIRQLRRISLQSPFRQEPFTRQRTREARSFDDQFLETTTLSALLSETLLTEFQDDSIGARRSQITFRDEGSSEDASYRDESIEFRPSQAGPNDDYINQSPRSPADYTPSARNPSANSDNYVPSQRNPKITFQDESDYEDGTPEQESQGDQISKPYTEDTYKSPQVGFALPNRESNQRGYQDEYNQNPNQNRFVDYPSVSQRSPRNPTSVGFPGVSKAFHPRYPFHSPYFAPPKSFSNPEYENYYTNGNNYPHQEFSPIVKNSYFNPGFAPKSPSVQPLWKSRTPRVVFPYANENGPPSFQSNSHQGGTGNSLANGINYNNDNVVFRDQNFGLNDLSGIQDIRSDFNLQDIGTTGTGQEDNLKDRENNERASATNIQERTSPTISAQQRTSLKITTFEQRTNKKATGNQNENKLKTAKLEFHPVNVIDRSKRTFINHSHISNGHEMFLDREKLNSNYYKDKHEILAQSSQVLSSRSDVFERRNPLFVQGNQMFFPRRQSDDKNIRSNRAILAHNNIMNIKGSRSPKTLQYLLPHLTKKEIGSLKYLATNPPFDSQFLEGSDSFDSSEYLEMNPSSDAAKFLAPSVPFESANYLSANQPPESTKYLSPSTPFEPPKHLGANPPFEHSATNQIFDPKYPNPSYKLQEMMNESPSTEANALTTRQRQGESQKCNQGGTCEFFLYCWMSGGLLDGGCGGLLKGCCHRLAKTGALGVQDSNDVNYLNGLDADDKLRPLEFGPVINDNRKSINENGFTVMFGGRGNNH